jgi:hypothetical protein
MWGHNMQGTTKMPKVKEQAALAVEASRHKKVIIIVAVTTRINKIYCLGEDM